MEVNIKISCPDLVKAAELLAQAIQIPTAEQVKPAVSAPEPVKVVALVPKEEVPAATPEAEGPQVVEAEPPRWTRAQLAIAGAKLAAAGKGADLCKLLAEVLGPQKGISSAEPAQFNALGEGLITLGAVLE